MEEGEKRTVNILFLEWASFAGEDMVQVLGELGHHVKKIPFADRTVKAEKIKKQIELEMKNAVFDFLFSFNYFPEVSNACKETGLKYVAWVYDSPHINVYSYTVINPCNYIFLFDYAMYQDLKINGIDTVYYLPLGVNEKRLQGLKNTPELQHRYGGDISFVGSLYSEQKHNLYDRFQNMLPYNRGYLDGLMRAQVEVQGYNFLKEMLTEEIIADMEKAYPTNPNSEMVLSPESIYADYVLARQVTAMERRKILERLSYIKEVRMYTYDRNAQIGRVKNMGSVDYYKEMPYVFCNSKINLNITLRSIRTGIPLRALDIMGCGGFLLTNYQEELFQYFEPGKDFVYYMDYADLERKVKYYLRHEEERRIIAENGCRKVRMEHTIRQRFNSILDTVMEKGRNR